MVANFQSLKNGPKNNLTKIYRPNRPTGTLIIFQGVMWAVFVGRFFPSKKTAQGTKSHFP